MIKTHIGINIVMINLLVTFEFRCAGRGLWNSKNYTESIGKLHKFKNKFLKKAVLIEKKKSNCKWMIESLLFFLTQSQKEDVLSISYSSLISSICSRLVPVNFQLWRLHIIVYKNAFRRSFVTISDQLLAVVAVCHDVQVFVCYFGIGRRTVFSSFNLFTLGLLVCGSFISDYTVCVLLNVD